VRKGQLKPSWKLRPRNGRRDGSAISAGSKRTNGERTGRVSTHGPSPTSVERETFVLDDVKEGPVSERLRVGLTKDLEDVEREKNDLSDSGQANRRRKLTDSASLSFTRCKIFPSRLRRETHDPAAASLNIFPFFSPNCLVKKPPSFLWITSRNQG
jgi:hypothetical protein